METIEFITAVDTPCRGYLWGWQGLSFGLTRDSTPRNDWDVIELATGCSVVGKPLSTRKKATQTALDILNEKGIKVVKKKIRDVLIERVNTPVKGRIKTVHGVHPKNRLKTICGRAKDAYCLPAKLLKKAKKLCQRCLKATRKKY